MTTAAERRPALLDRLIGTDREEGMAIVKAIANTSSVRGHVCEFGVAQGATSALIASEIMESYGNLHLFDSFAGLPAPTKEDALLHDIFKLGSMGAYEGKMACPRSMVEARLRELGFPDERVVIHDGYLKDTFDDALRMLDYSAVRFAYVDLDLYESTKLALALLTEVASPGAIVIVDDYGYFSSGVEKAVQEVDRIPWNVFPPSGPGYCTMVRRTLP